MKSESAIQKEIIDVLKLQGFLVFRMNSGKSRKNVYMCPAGTPDLLAISPSMMFWIEVKKEDGCISPEQAAMHIRLNKLGQTVLIARRVEDVIQYIKKLVF